MNRSIPTALLVVVLSGALPVLAQSQDATPAPVTGPEARAWLELQKGGTAASPTERPLPGEIADRSYQRYAESFSHPIPETLDREGFISEGGN